MCRVFLYDLLNTKDTYGNWLRNQSAQAYVWGLDEIALSNPSGSWGPGFAWSDYQAMAISSNITRLLDLPDGYRTNRTGTLGFPQHSTFGHANDFSCIHATGVDYQKMARDDPRTGHWWTVAARHPGCQDNIVGGKPPNPQVVRHGGHVVVSFTNLQ